MALRGANGTAVLLLTSVVGPDAIGWAKDVIHSADHCINPAPFGQQCTLHMVSALAACLRSRGCNSFTCPSPDPYVRGGRRDGIHAAICQLRSVSRAAWEGGANRETRHGMCKPGRPGGKSCSNFFLSPLPRWSPATKLDSLFIRARQLIGSLEMHRRATVLVVHPDVTLSELGLPGSGLVQIGTLSESVGQGPYPVFAATLASSTTTAVASRYQLHNRQSIRRG